ncbi:MAG: septum formation initiator family protein [Pseudomonadota bacterium]|nr:septum formation initiator family protein [Gammaproteobacteria bacterium]MBU1558458.1 septum formation initiator family protein [Gammaproteobacteria bacterium]MBU1629266.1 septum formation initiator family protein [Gammaproteobacteria bacterium]MBU1926524.1 septum formation initiator family protein [Gammaproteobacteria bacterium]MBU2546021.1 septum formation initiator family protein [Gammaproteobacteria bacterium]
MSRILIVLMVVALVMLQFKIWFSPSGVIEGIHLHRAIAQQEKINMQLAKKNKKLLQQILELKHGEASIELLAREDLGMVKSGETFYQIVDRSN